MAKIKVKRKDEAGKEAELEIEESEALETDVRIPEQPPGKQGGEKTLTQSEVNKLMADQRREHESKIKALQADYDAFKKSIEDKEKAANEAAAKQVEELRKDLPEPIGKLLDKLTPIEQLEWLRDPANAIPKQEIPPLPPSATPPGKGPKIGTII